MCCTAFILEDMYLQNRVWGQYKSRLSSFLTDFSFYTHLWEHQITQYTKLNKTKVCGCLELEKKIINFIWTRSKMCCVCYSIIQRYSLWNAEIIFDFPVLLPGSKLFLPKSLCEMHSEYGICLSPSVSHSLCHISYLCTCLSSTPGL